MENLYPLFLEKIFILNPSQAFQTLYKWAEKSLLKKTNTEKIFIVQDSNLKSFYEQIPIHQLPTTHGGELPELQTFWFFSYFLLKNTKIIKIKQASYKYFRKIFKKRRKCKK